MILVTGASGQLGSDVCAELSRNGEEFISASSNRLDITDKAAVENFFGAHKIDSVIHCAAYTAVDKAESDKERCFAVNAEGTRNIAVQCKKSDACLLYVSTDYVFGGSGDEPHEPNDEKNPLNVYAQSKLLGEEIVSSELSKFFIVRTSWVFGEKNTNFIATMLRLSQNHDLVSVVCDQIGSPTYSSDLAKLLCKMIKTESYGVFHATNEGFCSWAQLAQKVFELSGKDTKVKPVKTSEYPTAAKRPLNSRLSKKCLDAFGFSHLPSWENAVERYLKNISETKKEA